MLVTIGPVLAAAAPIYLAQYALAREIEIPTVLSFILPHSCLQF
jgi:hypothetical protein